MNTELIFDILRLAISLVEAQVRGPASQDLSVDETLAEIVQKGLEAYQLDSGKALDTSFIKDEAEI
jgi:hypothetical protein